MWHHLPGHRTQQDVPHKKQGRGRLTLQVWMARQWTAILYLQGRMHHQAGTCNMVIGVPTYRWRHRNSREGNKNCEWQYRQHHTRDHTSPPDHRINTSQHQNRKRTSYIKWHRNCSPTSEYHHFHGINEWDLEPIKQTEEWQSRGRVTYHKFRSNTA